MGSYLDKAGLSRFWSAIKSYVDAHSGGGVSLNTVYPVGSIYMSVNSTSPATLFGGTWERIQDRFLLAAGSTYNAGGTGGEAAHQLTANELPDHKHTFVTSIEYNHTHALSNVLGSSGGVWTGDKTDNLSNGNETRKFGYIPPNQNVYTQTATGAGGQHSHTGTTDGAGGTQPHNNMPPYLAVYMWQRTA